MRLKKLIRKNFVNIPGWRTKRKIVVFESDDWGSIRMPSREAYDFLLKEGLPVDKNYFTKYDCLESNEDIEALFDVLNSFTDINEKHPVITANALVCNPDFVKIEKSKKQQYHFESILETYKHYPKHDKVLDLWKQKGMAQNIFYPQFHGREHLNVKKWLQAINASSEYEDLAFDQKTLLGIGNKGHNSKGRNEFNYMAAFEYSDEDEKLAIEKITQEGLDLFKEIFGIESKSFIASQAIRGEHLDKVLTKNGVDFHQGGQQLIPQGDGTLKIINRFWGAKNAHGQMYWRRNVSFEPSSNQDQDWVNSTLKEIEIAFRWGKPAVINSHRVNYIGSIFKENREQSLKKLTELLASIIKKWPQVEFMSSEQLGALLVTKK